MGTGEALNGAGLSFALAGGPKAAAVICRTPHGNLHAGLLHRDASGVVSALHLGWQDRLYDGWDDGGCWEVPRAEPEQLAVMAGLCRRIWKKYQSSDRRFPYALKFMDTRFDAQGGLVFGPGASGLTCATLVLAVFRTSGLSLIEEESWPIRKDDDLRFLEGLRRFATPVHFALLLAEVESGCKRIRPDEVLGACTLADLPAKFEPTVGAARAIVARLDVDRS